MKIITPTRIDLSKLSNEYENELLEFFLPFYQKIRNFKPEILEKDMIWITAKNDSKKIVSRLKYQSFRSGTYEIVLTSKKPFLRQPHLSLTFTNRVESSDPHDRGVTLNVTPEMITVVSYLCILRFFMSYLQVLYPGTEENSEYTHQWLISQLTKKILTHPEYVVQTERDDTLNKSFKWACEHKNLDLMEYLISSPELVKHVNIVDDNAFWAWCEKNNQMTFYFEMMRSLHPHQEEFRVDELSLNF